MRAQRTQPGTAWARLGLPTPAILYYRQTLGGGGLGVATKANPGIIYAHSGVAGEEFL